MDTAVLADGLKLPGYDRRRAEYLACNWLPTKWDWVDPLKDANAEIAQIEAGLKSRTQAIAERGYDAEQVDAEIARDREREKRLGLDFRRPGSPAQGPGTTDPNGSDPNADDQNASDATQDPNPDTVPQEAG
jgi:capsid protein